MSRKRSETKARARKGDRVKEETGKKLHKRDKDKTQNNDVIARHTHSLGSAQLNAQCRSACVVNLESVRVESEREAKGCERE